jgi:Rod binding domain-containing protein
MTLSTNPFPTTRRGAGHPILNFGVRGPMSQHDKLVQQTRKWVAMAFFEPMLKQVRESPFHSTLLDGGEAGKAFGAMYDERLAESMASNASDSLVGAIVKRIEGSRSRPRGTFSVLNAEREGADRVRAARAAAATPVLSGDQHVPPYI